jgi:hypothetical protein
VLHVGAQLDDLLIDFGARGVDAAVKRLGVALGELGLVAETAFLPGQHGAGERAIERD